MRLRVVIFGVLGILATLFGVAIIYSPSLVETAPLQPIEAWGDQRSVSELLFFVGLAVLLYLLFAARSGTSNGEETPSERRLRQTQEMPPELVTADKRQLAAASLDDSFSRAVEQGGRQFQNACDLLYRTATVTYAEAAALSPDTAQQQIDSGTWTDDPTAAALLSSEDGPQPSLLARLHLWLRPERERERRLKRTVDTINDIQQRRPQQ